MFGGITLCWICKSSDTWRAFSDLLAFVFLSFLSGDEDGPVGKPRALYPETGVCEHVRQLVRLHASGALAVPPGPRAFQGPRVRPAQEVQRPGTCLRWTTRLTDWRTDRQTVKTDRLVGGQTGKRREKPEVQKSAGGGEKSPSAGSGPIRGPELPLVEGPPPQESVKAQDWRRGEGAGSPSFSFVQCIGSLRLTDRTEGGGIVPGCECPYQSCCCCFELKKKKKTMVRVFPHRHHMDWCNKLKRMREMKVDP